MTPKLTDQELHVEIQKCGMVSACGTPPAYSISYPEAIHILRLIRAHDSGETNGLGERKSI